MVYIYFVIKEIPYANPNSTIRLAELVGTLENINKSERLIKARMLGLDWSSVMAAIAIIGCEAMGGGRAWESMLGCGVNRVTLSEIIVAQGCGSGCDCGEVLHSGKTSKNVLKAIIVAEYSCVQVELAPNFEMGVSNKTPKSPEFLNMNPIEKVPLLETPDGPIRGYML
ncbi:hypothetical protein RHSIM_Rhsim04G0159600 [Rhododendron simsii]|uniref:GST N-terminal domain-containing protein n=1 Tax=Rhododendron simsii TaxID=118357 RepID=A0A834H2P5_RHOSS|nr:hypothetical protein RHSIM_Rhsim04G0159600 [Rhododendron simsii]